MKERKKDDKEQNNKTGVGKVGTAGQNKQNFSKKPQNFTKGFKKFRPSHKIMQKDSKSLGQSVEKLLKKHNFL